MDLASLLNNVGLIYNGKTQTNIWHPCGTIENPRSGDGRYYIDEDVVFWYNWKKGIHGGINIKHPVAKVKRKIPIYIPTQEQQLPLKLTFDKCNYHEYIERKQCVYTNNLLQDREALIIPMQNHTYEIMSYQRIYNNGNKLFAKGRLSKGLFYRFTTGKDSKFTLLAEGWATANAIHQCTAYDVYACLSACNIKHVYNYLKDIYNPVVIADNDIAGINACIGLRHVVIGNDGEDFNDTFIRLGLWDTMDLLHDHIKSMV